LNGYCPILGAIQLKLSKIRTESMQRHNYIYVSEKNVAYWMCNGVLGCPSQNGEIG